MDTFSYQHGAISMRCSYDRRVDVLRLATQVPDAIEGDGLPRGVELDYAVDSGLPCGVTVIGYKRNNWQSEVGSLAQIISRHLTIDPLDVVRTIEEIVAQ